MGGERLSRRAVASTLPIGSSLLNKLTLRRVDSQTPPRRSSRIRCRWYRRIFGSPWITVDVDFANRGTPGSSTKPTRARQPIRCLERIASIADVVRKLTADVRRGPTAPSKLASVYVVGQPTSRPSDRGPTAKEL